MKKKLTKKINGFLRERLFSRICYRIFTSYCTPLSRYSTSYLERSFAYSIPRLSPTRSQKMSSLLKNIYNAITIPTKAFQKRESLTEKITNGVYIVAYNECNERRIIHDSGDVLQETKEDIIFIKRQDLKVLVLKCEDLLAYFKKKVMGPKYRIPERRSKDDKLCHGLNTLIECIYDELDYNNESGYEHFIYRYEEFRDVIKRHSTSFRILNKT